MSNEIDEKYRKIGDILNKAGPFILSESVIEILKKSISEEDLDFLLAFKRKISQTMEQLKESINKYCQNSYTEEEILEKVDRLAKRGVMFDQPNRHGVVVFKLAPIYRQFEYLFMKKLDKNEENLELARLFHEAERNLGAIAQRDYENLPNMVKGMPAQDRTVPIRTNKETGKEINIIIDKELEVPSEQILSSQDIKEIIEKFDDIAVGQCYCRQKEDFMGHPCKQNPPGESCFTLGKSARHTAKHGFSRLISKEEALKIKDAHYLVQGTLYSDVIESGTRDAAKIKSHHNVGGLPKDMKLKLIEPLRLLFKDEIRKLGIELGLSDDIVWRQPFPGPGLAIRIIGDVTAEKIKILQEADSIVIEEIKRAGLYKKIWQSFAILPSIKSVGVMGDERTYAYPIAIRAVSSLDAMTADWVRLPYKVLERLSGRIINEVDGVNRVIYDISSKPPSTIEWE